MEFVLDVLDCVLLPAVRNDQQYLREVEAHFLLPGTRLIEVDVAMYGHIEGVLGCAPGKDLDQGAGVETMGLADYDGVRRYLRF